MGAKQMSNDKFTIGPSTPPPPTICITANDYRPLLTIHPDGTVTGEIEDASEAARLFVESLRGYLTQPTQSDALREALEAAPLIGATESAEIFKARQDAWLNGQYRAALQEQSK
jgi:hypothetical protein